jgi:hypothetical protein
MEMGCLKTGREIGNRKGKENGKNKAMPSYSLPFLLAGYIHFNSQ